MPLLISVEIAVISEPTKFSNHVLGGSLNRTGFKNAGSGGEGTKNINKNKAVMQIFLLFFFYNLNLSNMKIINIHIF